MLVDLRPGRPLEARVLPEGDSASFPTSPWRNLIVAPRTNEPVLTQARALVVEHLDAAELALLAEWPPSRAASRAEWTESALHALARGLAHKMVSKAEPAIGAVLADVLSGLTDPTFQTNRVEHIPAWNPFTEHTFDVCLVAADASAIAVVFVVDED